MKPSWPHPLIAREGWPYVTGTLVFALLIHALLGLAVALPFWVIAIFVLQFFRDPARSIPADPDAILSPADGRVIKVEEVVDPWRQRPALKISVFMNVFNVHSNRMPVDGTIRGIQYSPGAFINADLDKASEANERNAVLIERRDGSELTCVQVAGLVARRILCYVAVGDGADRGTRFGFIRFGSRVDTYLPVGARPAVSIGDKVKAASTILARLAERSPAESRSSSDATVVSRADAGAAATEAQDLAMPTRVH